MYAETGEPNIKWEDTDFKCEGRAPLPSPPGDGPLLNADILANNAVRQ